VKTINTKLEAKAPIEKLTPHPDNPRNGDLEAIGRSVDANGFYGVVVAQQSTGRILSGNHRYYAALERGAKTIPVAWIDVDDRKALEILVSDNRSSDLGKYDESQLAGLLTKLQADGGLGATLYGDDDLANLLRTIEATSGRPLNVDAEWNGMPAFTQNNLQSVFHTTVHFASDEDADAFFKLVGQSKASSIWFPEHDGHVGSNVGEAYVAEE
jgi:hypothetical protein